MSGTGGSGGTTEGGWVVAKPETPDPARAAAVAAVLGLVEPGMTIGLGSGRAVFALCDAIGARWDGGPPLRAAVASGRTRARALAAGIEVVEPDGTFTLDLAIDGADEVAPDLGLIKGGGESLLREKLVAQAAARLVIVAEHAKLVDRLGQTFRLPVEVVRYAWADTRRRLLAISPEVTRRVRPDGGPVVTEEGHYLVDCAVPDLPPAQLADAVKRVVGVVEHGLFLGMADEVILGRADGTVENIRA